VYPETGVKVFKIWIVILAFVSIQLAWNLRPFLSEKHEKFQFIGKYKGNFYTALVYSFEQILHPKEKMNTEIYERFENSETDRPLDTEDSTEPIK
jgi:hypothetical protein